MIILGDCLTELRSLADESVDSIITDPPYGLAFMGKKWDYDVPGVEVWKECFRVLKPGGHLLSFFGSRTYHRGVIPIEDAGFEIRDQIMWLYGSGFPKSHNIGKSIDKSGGGCKMFMENRKKFAAEIKRKREEKGVSRNELASWFPQYKEVTKNWERLDGGFRVPTEVDYQVLIDRLGVSDNWREQIRAEDKRLKRESIKSDRKDDGSIIGLGHRGNEYEATTPEAQEWEGWGSALKPAHEPIVLARKPLSEGTIAGNVLKHGTGGINIDGCRIGTEFRTYKGAGSSPQKIANHTKGDTGIGMLDGSGKNKTFTVEGRFPANVIHDGVDEPWGHYFYCAKASKKDRGGNNHPTVKPTDLMRYLCRLVTPPGGVVLDPFMGSGSTGKAAQKEGFEFIGIEREPEYVEIARQRI